jgi:hypothetical protein
MEEPLDLETQDHRTGRNLPYKAEGKVIYISAEENEWVP